MSWFTDEIVDKGKLPLVLGFVAFIVTFLVTRTIVRMIRAGRGPFKNNVSDSGLHIHHVVPGVLILIVGGFLTAGAHATEPWAAIGGTLVGVGAGLVLDEFALILTLDDVYWAKEGRVSVEMVGLAAASLGIFLVFGSPFADDSDGGDVVTLVISIALHLLCVYITLRKGKVRTAVIGFFLPLVAEFSAIRLARPGSAWAKRFYKRPKKVARAEHRAVRSDARWAPLARWLGDTVAGAVTPDAAEAPGHPGASDDQSLSASA
jgi:hypothetical protein